MKRINIKKSLSILLLFGSINLLVGCGRTIHIPIEEDTTKYIVDNLKNKDSIKIPVNSACINNPKAPSTITVLLNADGKSKVLQLDIIDKLDDGHFLVPAEKDALFYVDKNSMITYDNEQYIEIEQSKQDYTSTDLDKSVYETFHVVLHVKDVDFGENSNGKFAPIKAQKVTQ